MIKEKMMQDALALSSLDNRKELGDYARQLSASWLEDKITAEEMTAMLVEWYEKV